MEENIQSEPSDRPLEQLRAGQPQKLEPIGDGASTKDVIPASVEIRVRMNFNEYILGSTLYLMRRRWYAPLLAILIIGFLMLTTISTNPLPPSAMPILVVVGVLSLPAIAFGLVLGCVMLSVFNWFRFPSLQELNVFELSDDKVISSGPSYRNEFSWTFIRWATETHGFLYLQMALAAVMIPKRCIPDHALPLVREILRSNLGKKAYVR